MKKNEVKVGGLYMAKVSDKLVTVRIDGTHSGGGWNATNTATGKRIRIKSAQRLRGAAGKTAKAEKAANAVETAVQPDVAGRDDEKGESRDGAQAAVVNGEKAVTPEAAIAKDEKTRTSKTAVAEDEKAEATGNAASKEGGEEKPATKKAKSKKANGDAPADEKPKRASALDAAAQVLAEAGKPMRARELIAAMAEQGLWSSPAGKTPHATLYASMMREARDKGDASRFRKADRGLFEFNAEAK